MPVALLLLLVQIAFVIHVVKTGRDRYWIFLIIFLPAIGCAIYFFTQVLPEMGQSHTVHRAKRSLIKAVDPERELRRRKEELAVANTIENRMKLADECIEAGLYKEAIELLQQALNGPHQDDPYILLLLARAQFGAEEFAKSRQTLDEIMEKNPGFKSPDGHLLYARSLEGLEMLDAAAAEYEVLVNSYPGEEARVRYGLLLLRMGQSAKAKGLFTEATTRAKRAPRYYRKKEQPWLALAQKHMTN